MGKYTDISDSVYSIFASPTWSLERITTIPSNFAGSVGVSDYIRVSVLINGDNRTNRVSGSGILMIDIFTAAGLGMKVTNDIADRLDVYLENRTITSNGISSQFKQSSTDDMGLCKDNSSLHRSTYSLPFNYYGVTN